MNEGRFGFVTAPLESMRSLSVPTLEFPADSPLLSVPDTPVVNTRSVGISDLESKLSLAIPCIDAEYEILVSVPSV